MKKEPISQTISSGAWTTVSLPNGVGCRNYEAVEADAKNWYVRKPNGTNYYPVKNGDPFGDYMDDEAYAQGDDLFDAQLIATSGSGTLKVVIF